MLAEIDTPDLDQQLMQARADLSVAQANAKLAQITAKRWQSLAGTDAVAKQDVDQRTFTWNANIAQVKAAQANVDRLVAEEGFKRLIAPFDGIVTARETDIGALINVGAAGGAELFVVSDTEQAARLCQRAAELRAQRAAGHQGHDPRARTSRQDLQRHGRGFGAGGRPEHRHDADADHRRQQRRRADAGRLRQHPSADRRRSRMCSACPRARVIFDAKGLSVATVDADNRVLLKPVSIERDLGAIVELASGVAPSDRVIENPPDGIGEWRTWCASPTGAGRRGRRRRSIPNEKG